MNEYNYLDVPKWAQGNNKILGTFGGDLSDNVKFSELPLINLFGKHELFYSCDDDLIYPPEYVAYLRTWLIDHPVVSLHGRKLQTTGNYLNSYYRGSHLVYDYRCHVADLQEVEVIGTGVAAIDTSKFCPSEIYRSPFKKMSDLVFSLEAAKQGVPLFVVPHPENWVQSIQMSESICQEQQNQPQLDQIDHVKQIMQLKGMI